MEQGCKHDRKRYPEIFKRLNSSNPKSIWKVVKYLTKQNSAIPILIDSQEKPIHDDAEKANLLKDFFASCFSDAQPLLNMSISLPDFGDATVCTIESSVL